MGGIRTGRLNRSGRAIGGIGILTRGVPLMIAALGYAPKMPGTPMCQMGNQYFAIPFHGANRPNMRPDYLVLDNVPILVCGMCGNGPSG